MIRIEAVWLCVEPMDMRAGTDTTLARVVRVFGAYSGERDRVARSGPAQDWIVG